LAAASAQVTSRHARNQTDMGNYCVRGGIDPVSPYCSISYGADIDLQQTDRPYAL
jgi:hypothetical protein